MYDNGYFNVYCIYCEKDVVERFKRIERLLANKKLMFKFNGKRYAIFSLDSGNKTQFIGFNFTIEELEKFAEEI